jgi:hypothetical protein
MRACVCVSIRIYFGLSIRVVYSLRLFVDYDCFAFVWVPCHCFCGGCDPCLWACDCVYATGYESSVAVAICYRMDARVSIAGIMSILAVAKPVHVRTVSLFHI